MHVAGSEARRSQEFTPETCRAILQGFRRQLVYDGRLSLGIVGIQRPEEKLTDVQLGRIVGRHAGEFHEDVDVLVAEASGEFVDALTGQPLVPELVRAARRLEIE